MKLFVVMKMKNGEALHGRLATEAEIQRTGKTWEAGWQDEVYRLDFVTRRLVKVVVEDYTAVNFRIVETDAVQVVTANSDSPRFPTLSGDDTPPPPEEWGDAGQPAPTTEQRPVRNSFFKPSDGS